MIMMEDNDVCKALESTIIQVATSGPTAQATASTVVKEIKLMAPVARFVAKQAKNEVSEAAQQSVLAVPPSLPSSPSDLVLSNEE